MTDLKWTKLDNGDRQADGLPIRLHKTRDVRGKYWVVQVPLEADSNMLDGWAWGDVWAPVSVSATQTVRRRLDDAVTLAEAEALASEHIEAILTYATEQRSGWPHTDGLPGGKYISNYAADGARTYTGVEPPALPASPIAVSWPGPARPSFQSEANRVFPENELRALTPPLVLELRQVVTDLDHSIEEFRASVPKSVDHFIRTQEPEEVRDANGRPVLGDWLAAKANALAALANLEASR